MKQTKKGGFTLPGEAGCEALTLELADRWGADVIRDSDGTELSDEILDAGYSIYSTICLIRDHNEWAHEHPDCLQQTFLTTRPCLAGEGPLSVALLADFFDEQFRVNDGEPAGTGRSGTAPRARCWTPAPGTGSPAPAASSWTIPRPTTAIRSASWPIGSGKRSRCTTI